MIVSLFKTRFYAVVAGLLFIITIIVTSCNTPTEKTPLQITKTDSVKVSEESLVNEKIKKDPSNSELYFKRATLRQQKGNNSEAKDDINLAISLDSSIAKYFIFRADLSFADRQTIEARKDLKKAIQLDDQSTEAYLKLTEIYLLLANYDEAIQNADEALKIDKYNAKAYFMKGMSFKRRQDTARAISSFTTAVEQDAKYYDAHLQLGILYETSNPKFAIDFYNNAIRTQPNNLEAIYHKSFYLQNLKQSRKALEGYKLMLDIDPANRNALYNTGFIYLVQLQNYDSASIYFDQAIKNYPTDFEAWYNLGLSYEEANNKKQALFCYKKTLAIKPDYTLAAKGVSRVS